LVEVEKMVFEKHTLLLNQGSVLDIGIGGGRTTAFLLPRSKKYTGIDYSENFVKEVNKNYPGAAGVMDARDLSGFQNKSFDFVNFSFNGIDYVDAEGRKTILNEIAGVLKPGGIFFFSTHNKNHPSFNRAPWLNKNNSVSVNIKTFLKLLPFIFRRLKKQKHIESEFALITDSAHNYSLTTFYTSPGFLRKQLSEAGFQEIEFYLKSGELKDDANLGDWIFVTAKRL
jgi:SAM-dependent methyltransferase